MLSTSGWLQAVCLLVNCFMLLKRADAQHYVDHGRWGQVDGNFYRDIYPDTPVTFAEAQSLCQSIGGNLLSIHSIADNNRYLGFFQFFSSISGGTYFWIGGIQSNADEPYRWTDGTPFDYDNWFPGQPDGGNYTQNCTRFLIAPDPDSFGAPGTWDDISCDTEIQNSIVCQRPGANLKCGQPGFHVNTQLTNTKRAVDWAMDHGATGVQMDLQIDAAGEVVNFQHGAPCDCCCYCGPFPNLCNGTTCNNDSICAALIIDSPGAPCDAATDAVELLEYVADKPGVVTVIINTHLPDGCNATVLAAAGVNVAELVMTHLQDAGFNGVAIINAQYTTHVAYLQAAAARLNQANNLQYSTTVRYTISRGTESADGAQDIVETIQAQQTIPSPYLAYQTGTSACNPSPNSDILYNEDLRKLAAYNEAKGVVGLSFTWTVDNTDAILHSFYFYHGVVTSFPGKVVALAANLSISLVPPCTLIGDPTALCVPCNTIPETTATEIVSDTDEYDCACTYHGTTPKGCTISTPAPARSACFCDKMCDGIYVPLTGLCLGQWKCMGTAVACRDQNAAVCVTPDTTLASCMQGYGNCNGYP